MNKIILTAISITLILGNGLDVFGNSVDMEMAKRVAQNYMNLNRQTSNEILDVVTERFEGQNSFYVVNFREGGWVMVSADDSTVPVFGYNDSGIYRTDDEKPDGFLFLLSEYKEQIDIARKSISKRSSTSAKRNEIAGMWSSLLSDENNNSMLRSSTRLTYGSYTVGDILLNAPGRGEVAWGQSRNNSAGCNPSYNMFAEPSGGCDCDRTPIGCGAVAMGQVMWYWQYPKIFNWDLMPAKLYEGQMAEGKEIATLLRLFADGAGMIYRCSGSFALPMFMGIAVRGFDFKTASVESASDWGTQGSSQWLSLIRTEISCRRPVVYKGEKSLFSGEKHYFVIDGYSTLLIPKFHINFGWKGSHNGFFYLWNITSNDFDYNSNHTAIIGISPTYASETNITDVSFSSITGRSYLDAQQNISLPQSGKNLDVEAGGLSTLAAGNSIRLGPGFHAKAGSKFNAIIDPLNAIDMEITVPSWPTVADRNWWFKIPVNNANSSDFTVMNSSGNIIFQSANITLSGDAILWLGAEEEKIPQPGVYTCRVRFRNNYGRCLTHTWDVSFENIFVKSSTNIDTNEKEMNESYSMDYMAALNLQNNIDFINSNSNILIYPNPNNGNFIVEFNTLIDACFEIQIMNQIGITLVKKCIKNKEEITIPNAQPGVYYIHVNINNEVFSKKIIVR